MIEIPFELLFLVPLSIAAGVDLYLTLLFIGAAPTTGLWDLPLPGALGDLDPPSVLIVLGAFFLAELTVERFRVPGLAWNALHAVIRPVSGALLALLLLDGQPLWIVGVGAVTAGTLASFAHGVRTGARVLTALSDDQAPSPFLLSLAEDVVVLGLVALTLDAPLWATLVGTVALAAAAPGAPSLLRAFAYAIRLVVGRVFRTLGLRRWRRADELPGWIRTALRDDEDALAHGDALRGCTVGAWRLEGAPRFCSGWVIVSGRGPRFLMKSRKDIRRIDLRRFPATSVLDRDLYRRIDLQGSRKPAVLLVGWSGPSTESLSAEFTRDEG